MKLTPGRYQIICRYMGYKEKLYAVNLYQDRKIDMAWSRKYES
jgi:hypothetical protein